MGNKNLSWCWRKGNRVYLSSPGVKGAYAKDLLRFRHIRTSKADCKKFKLICRPYPMYLYEISTRKAIKILESKGWTWEKVEKKDE